MRRPWYVIVSATALLMVGTYPAWSGEYAITGTNVLTMETPQVLEGYTVLVSGDRITAVGPSGSVTIPPQAIEIDGRGKYLMPGLTDMHIHIWEARELMLYVTNGITTVRNMWGAPQHLQWRQEIRAGTLLGPELYTTSPLIEGVQQAWVGSVRVYTAAQAQARVQEYKQAGYDWIKIYHTILNRAVYDAIFAEAALQDIPVVGHVPFFSLDTPYVDLVYPTSHRMKSLEHINWYLPYLENGDVLGNPFDFYTPEVDSQKVAEMSELFLEGGTWICPTFAVTRNYITADEYQAALRRPYMEYVPYNRWHTEWVPDPNRPYPEFIKVFRQLVPEMKIIKGMYESGVNLLTGTDNPNPFTIPGFSIHEELAIFVEAGFSPYEALRISTRNAAEFMDALDEFGSIAPGLRADMILLNRNPLENVAYVQDRTGVMVRGQWYTESWLREKLNRAYTALPRRISLVHPAEGSALYELPDSLVWGDMFSVTEGYHLQVFGDNNLTAPVIDDTVRAETNSVRPDTTWPLELPDGVYWWRVTGLNNVGSGPSSTVWTFSIVTGDAEPILAQVPGEYALSQNYPNPFNPTTTIEYALPHAGYATLKVYSVLGEEVATIVEGNQAAGMVKTVWDASASPSGIYFYRLTAGDYTQTKKMVVMK